MGMLHNTALKWSSGYITTCSTNDRRIKTAERGDIVLKSIATMDVFLRNGMLMVYYKMVLGNIKSIIYTFVYF